MGMRVLGIQRAENRFKKFKENLPDAAGEGVLDSAEGLYAESQVQVPKKTGALAGTGHIVPHSTAGNVRSYGVRYGQPGEGEGIIDYAAAVHEILKASHAAPTKAKYVEDPLVAGTPRWKKNVKNRIERAKKKAFR